MSTLTPRKKKREARSYQREGTSSTISSSSDTMTTAPSSRTDLTSPSDAGNGNLFLRGQTALISEAGSSTQSLLQSAKSNGLTNFAHPAFTDIGNKLKECNDTLADIQLLGVSHVVDLPELVLVGDQSSGKSTLMSALARLNKDSHWSCTVSLQREYEYCPPPARAITQSDVTKQTPFPPWVLKSSTETVVFKTIHQCDSNAIDEILRWAQVAALNPTQNPEQFVPGEGTYAKENTLETATRSTEASFSPNVVAFEIKAPGLPPLSFYDLPGVFAVADNKGDDYLVDVVENLTKKYVGHEGAIIMLALPMDQDIDNSKTLRIIRQLNAETRTLGVLTKADRPNFNQPDTIASWLAVLDEKKQKVKENGFFITSLPPGKALDNLTAWEQSFFHGEAEKWPSAFRHYTTRCGVDQLRNHITQELGDAFLKSIPDIKQKFFNCQVEIQGQLDELPELPSNVEHEVRMSLRDFCSSVKRAVDNEEFEQESKGLTEEFSRSLDDLKPTCQLITEKLKPRVQEVVMVSDSSEDEPMSSKRRAPGGPTLVSTPKRRRIVDPFATPVKAENSPAFCAFQSPATFVSVLPQDSGGGLRMSLLEIQKQIKLKTRGGFGDVVPLEVHEKLCLQAVSKWQEPLNIYISRAITILKVAVIRALETSFKNFSRRLIYKQSYEFLMAFLKSESTDQSERLVQMYKNETYKAVTINESGLNLHKAKEKELLENKRLFIRAKAAGFVDEDQPFKRDGDISQEEKQEQTRLLRKLQEKLPEDEFQREMDVAAKVRAYYLTAATRFVDGISMDINSRLFRSFRDGALDDFLDEKLGLFPYPTQETYARLMEEDTATATRRERLRRERDKLSTALEKILEFERSLTGDTTPRHPYGNGAAEFKGEMDPL
ncbi:P-loop containing nucleoside triphosphate hydrolase protein [Xylaria palmicola]|nr:P-loop containing nucleoside triphosphate hydrolase protein [Xylaria palmicola]